MGRRNVESLAAERQRVLALGWKIALGCTVSEGMGRECT
jgi:hypothetical protein